MISKEATMLTFEEFIEKYPDSDYEDYLDYVDYCTMDEYEYNGVSRSDF